MEHKRLYRKIHIMKKTIIRKIIYVFVCLFLLCNFFCLDKDGHTEADAFSYNDSPSITIHVPNGIQMEIKSEKSSSAVVASTIAKAAQLKTFSNFRYFLYTLILVILGCFYIFKRYNLFISEATYLRTFVIRFIHNKDGRKRI
ncbi:hypothetical protein SAMN02745725_02442 [Pseudobutyrivibrio xylanivorans DSM 14809]|uniref:Uncharacterized protein n=1 Tax=Pseudobutyrivibrio xylanivorans DSM 14809 TaxID=1123012 RepID=A0A1M6IY90_PSEXY|nr:hypothetical protein SAMN02745725_02442 [Pseudobutyrivibrio xylanivorans DSM 14809]